MEEPDENVLVCQHLKVVDEHGETRIEMCGKVSEGGPRISVFDGGGCERFVITINTDGSALIALRREKCQTAISIAASDTEAAIRVFSPDGRPKITLGVGSDDIPKLNGFAIDELMPQKNKKGENNAGNP